MNEVRDPREVLLGDADIGFLWRKISAAGEMKTAIKRFLDHHSIPSCSHIVALRRAMEDYLNLT